MSASGRPDYQPDFLTGAFNTVKSFGQGLQDFLGAASQAPVVGGALQGLGTVGGAVTGVFGVPALASSEGARQAAIDAYRTLEGGVPDILDIPAYSRSLNAAREKRADELRSIAENQNALPSERDKAAIGQFLYGGLPNVAPVPLIPKVPTRAASGVSDLAARTAPRAASGLERMVSEGKSFSRVAEAERVVSEAANPSVAPTGLIGARMKLFTDQGLTPDQAFTAVSHQFGQKAALDWATTGNDLAIGPKMGSGAPKPNLGVNLDKIDAPQTTKDFIQKVAQENAGFVEQRRGVVTIAETQAAADKITVDASKYAYIKPGTAFNAEQIKANFDAMVTKGNEATALQEALKAERAAGVSSKATELRALSAALEHQTLQRVFAGVRAESGRALRVQREIANGLRSGDVNATWNRASDLLGGKANAGALLARLQDIWTDPKLTPIERETAVYRFIRNMSDATTQEKIAEYWTNAILSSPSTHLTNIAGQALLQIADMGTNFVTAAVEALSSGFGRARPREYTFSAAFGSFASLGRGFRQAVANLRDADKINATKFRETGQLGQSAIGGKVGAVVNVPTHLLGAEDAVFRGLGEARGLYEGAYNVAAKENLRPFSKEFAARVAELIDNPTPEIVSHMEEMGKRAGLRQDAGLITQELIRLRRNVHVGPVQPLRFVIPFITTPVNLVKVGAEYSPLGFVRAISKTGAGRSEAIARGALGSAAMGYFVQEFANGNITAAAPQNPAEKDAFYAQGKIPFAVNLGGIWYSYSRLEPIATPLKWTAALMQTAQESQGKSWDVTASKMVFALAKYMEDSTYLQGLSDFVNALQDPSKAATVVENLITGFNPAIVRRVVQANDPYIRNPNNMLEQIEATLPYLNEQVSVRQTAFGEPAKRTEGKQGISGVISPIDYSPQQNDPLLQKVSSYQLPESIGPDGKPLPVRGLTIGLVSQDIATFSLNDAEAQRYQQYAGQATRNLLTKLFDDKLPYDGKAFSTLAYEDQIRAIRKTVSDARDVGRSQVADEILSEATNDGQVARGAIMRLSTIGTLRDEARFIEGLQRQGLLTSGVKSLIDQRRNKDKPTVDEYVKYAPLIDEYVNLPRYRIGNDAEWNELRRVKKAADVFADETQKPAHIETWRWYAQVDPAGAQLIRKYARTALRDPRRLQMLKENPGLERYVSGA